MAGFINKLVNQVADKAQGLNASSMLAANQPQTPNGTSLNASAMLGLPGLGDNLEDDLAEQLKRRRAAGGMDNPSAYGAANVLFGGMQ